MIVWRGGRGAKAPYETTHVRIPVDIKDQVEKLSNDYKLGIIGESKNPIPLEDAIEAAKKILKQKKSATVSLKSLLTKIYGESISL
jgi:hypothetical protein